MKKETNKEIERIIEEFDRKCGLSIPEGFLDWSEDEAGEETSYLVESYIKTFLSTALLSYHNTILENEGKLRN